MTVFSLTTPAASASAHAAPAAPARHRAMTPKRRACRRTSSLLRSGKSRSTWHETRPPTASGSRATGIYRDNALIITSPTDAYSDTGLSPGTYQYEVSAIDPTSNESARSNAAGAMVPLSDTQAPSIPQNLVATAISSSRIDLTWDASTDNVGVAGYNIYRDNVLSIATTC